MKQYSGIFIGMLLAISFSVLAFTEPTLAPPGGNVAAPINVSGTAQTKAGDLTVNNFYAKNFSVAPGVSEYNISNVNTVSGFNDLFLKGNSTESAPVFIAGSEIRAFTSGVERLTITSTGNVGIGTANPSRAKLETAGMVGNTLALFGQGTQGVSLTSNWPGIGFNSYFNGVFKSISSGWTGNIAYIASADNLANGGFVFRTGEWASGPDQTVGSKDVLQINNDGVATFHGPALVMDGVGKGRTDFVMRGDRGAGGRALVLDWGNELGLNWGGDFTGGIRTGSKLCVNGSCRGGIMFQVNGGHIQWGNNSLLATDQGGTIELGGDNTTPGAGTPYIDFHQAGITQDFNARIINDADGRLTLAVPTVYASNNINANDVFIRASGKWASQMGGGDTINGRKVHVPVQSTGFGDVGNDMGNTVRVDLWGFFDSDSFRRAACPQGYYMVGVGINGGSCPAMFCFEEIICRKLYD